MIAENKQFYYDLEAPKPESLLTPVAAKFVELSSVAD
jgi:hypothetical protein